MHPQIDLLYELVHIFGVPALIGALVWAVKTWEKGQHEFKEIGANTKIAVEKVTIVEAEVASIKSNHLVHLQDGIEKLAVSNDKAVEVLQKIDTGIQVLGARLGRD